LYYNITNTINRITTYTAQLGSEPGTELRPLCLLNNLFCIQRRSPDQIEDATEQPFHLASALAHVGHLDTSDGAKVAVEKGEIGVDK
jgi:hypothetical protein